MSSRTSFSTIAESDIAAVSLNNGCAETSLLRDKFLHASDCGGRALQFQRSGYMDLVFDLRHVRRWGDECTWGSGAGNFHVYNSNFLNTIGADMNVYNGGGFSARNNYSIGAHRFFDSTFTGNPAPIVLQGNTILDTVDDTSVYLQNEGPHMFLDNVYRSRAGFTGSYGSVLRPVSRTPRPRSWEILTETAILRRKMRPCNGRLELTRLPCRVVAINPSQPTLPGELPNLGRTITEVSRGANAAAIQSAINTACASNGTRPVVHIPYGNYSISTTLSVPVCDVQIIGDGMGDVQGTFLIWNGSGNGPVVSMAGPSRATIRDIEINGAGNRKRDCTE